MRTTIQGNAKRDAMCSHKTRLQIEAVSNQNDSPEQLARSLLRAILCQALHDGMLAIRSNKSGTGQ